MFLKDLASTELSHASNTTRAHRLNGNHSSVSLKWSLKKSITSRGSCLAWSYHLIYFQKLTLHNHYALNPRNLKQDSSELVIVRKLDLSGGRQPNLTSRIWIARWDGVGDLILVPRLVLG
jgi:hypothetical protein